VQLYVLFSCWYYYIVLQGFCKYLYELFFSKKLLNIVIFLFTSIKKNIIIKEYLVENREYYPLSGSVGGVKFAVYLARPLVNLAS